MKAPFVLAATLGISLVVTAGIVVEELPASLALTQAVRLADGSVLPAGPYDVQIHYKGFGNAAELWFFQKGQLKGKSGAEARGFPSTAPAGAANEASPKLRKASSEGKVFPKMEASSEGIRKADTTDKWAPAGAPAAFSWENLGFRKGHKGTISPGPPAMLKLSFDSTNSAAGFNATLPLIEKGRK